MRGGDAVLLGRWGEAQAAAYLQGQGYRIVAANYRCRFGEVDLVAEKAPYLAFIEVKLRKSSAFAPGRAFVNREKQRRLRTTAECYLAQRPTQLQPRFDVVELYAPHGMCTGHLEIVHLEDAF